MRYENFAYLWPPRPESAVAPRVLLSFEKRGWIAQVKKNGTCSVIFVAPDKTVSSMNRHNEDHKQWTATGDVMADFAKLPGTGWYVFVAELLHNKVANDKLRDINYVHDVLVADGEYLVGKTQEERQDILHDLLMTDDAVESARGHFIVSPHLWIPVEYDEGFTALFNGLTSDEDEGIVMKDPKQKLAFPMRQKANVAGQVKCRKPHKNFSF
jgi:hypothetical protein